MCQSCGNLTYRLKVISLALLTEYASGNGCDLYIAAITEIVLATQKGEAAVVLAVVLGLISTTCSECLRYHPHTHTPPSAASLFQHTHDAEQWYSQRWR